MAGTIPEVEAAAVQAWRRAVPEGGASEALLQHGLRVARLVRAAAAEADAAALRALTVAAVLHEIGLFVHDRGHFVARGARWMRLHARRSANAG